MQKSRSDLGVWALSVTAFAIGIAEFIVVGILPTISSALNVPLAQTGSLVGLYALALAIGTPIMVLLLSRFAKKTVLLALIMMFISGNVLAAISPNYDILLLGRVITAVAHGSFFAIGATVAVSMVAKERAGQAIALMFSGLTLAMVIGVPLGSLIGNSLNWRYPFYAVVLLGILSLLAIYLWVPTLKTGSAIAVAEQLKTLKSVPILTMMIITILGFGASFAAFTYITPILTEITRFSLSMANLLLVLFGIATLLGNIFGGRLVSRLGWASSTRWMLFALTLVLLLMGFLMQQQGFMLILLFVWGFLAFGVSPGFQSGMLTTAEKWTPKAIDFASGLNISAFNLGITLGEIFGSVFVGKGYLAYTPWIGVLLLILAQFPLKWLQHKNQN
ncbi:MFS transporter [Acinetobacter populi]|jgi:predicted MFS family arabinose efflux permease|uniref:MFS transporter n=1 Tax=Acinetobacter populi TaxID=1582270 RepID=A0A1Z9YYY8_9GAMM|nr:MFS transporter [Acinetobacter populi]MCH4247476.1 MFS transporter [Acinetobacter populi]OUY07413.1 MFS transporter [Acinetobacter populi]